MGKTAFVDLTTGTVTIEPSDPDALRLFLGGRGLASKILYDRVGPEVEPLSPDNLLIFSIGPLGGTPWPTSGRGHVTFKSPLTNAYGHSNSGGDFGAELAKAGYDALVISGQAPSPVYLTITDEGGHQVGIHPADDLWGLEVSEVCERAVDGSGAVDGSALARARPSLFRPMSGRSMTCNGWSTRWRPVSDLSLSWSTMPRPLTEVVFWRWTVARLTNLLRSMCGACSF